MQASGTAQTSGLADRKTGAIASEAFLSDERSFLHSAQVNPKAPSDGPPTFRVGSASL